MSGKKLKRGNVEYISNPGPELKKRRGKNLSPKKSEEEMTSTKLSMMPAGAQIVFVIFEIAKHTLESLVMKTINERSDVNKDKLFEELLRNIICVFLKYAHLDEDTTDLLKKRMNCMIYKLSKERDDITATFSKLGKDVESIYQNLLEMFPTLTVSN